MLAAHKLNAVSHSAEYAMVKHLNIHPGEPGELLVTNRCLDVSCCLLNQVVEVKGKETTQKRAQLVGYRKQSAMQIGRYCGLRCPSITWFGEHGPFGDLGEHHSHGELEEHDTPTPGTMEYMPASLSCQTTVGRLPYGTSHNHAFSRNDKAGAQLSKQVQSQIHLLRLWPRWLRKEVFPSYLKTKIVLLLMQLASCFPAALMERIKEKTGFCFCNWCLCGENKKLWRQFAKVCTSENKVYFRALVLVILRNESPPWNLFLDPRKAGLYAQCFADSFPDSPATWSLN